MYMNYNFSNDMFYALTKCNSYYVLEIKNILSQIYIQCNIIKSKIILFLWCHHNYHNF